METGGGNIVTGIGRVTRFRKPENVTEYIENFIADFESSKERKKMKYGMDYYRSQNTAIMQRKKLVYMQNDEGNAKLVEDPYKANYKLGSGFFKILVDQKINYLLGNDITFETEYQEELDSVLPQMFQKKVTKTAKTASIKSVGWKQAYIDGEGGFRLKHIPSEQVIPVFKPENNDELELAIRYYKVKVLNNRNEQVQVNRVEIWDDEMVAYYQENTSDGKYRLLDTEEMQDIFGEPYSNPKYHFQEELRFGDTVAESEGHGWGKVPFVRLCNNDECDYDLQAVKAFIDAYDIVNSDFVNNLEDFQDVYWVLKGYQGQNLNTFLEEVKRYKAMKVASDGEARIETIEIPVTARKEALAQLLDDIFTFGQGVNPNKVGDGNITNVVIKSRYANLDLKCDQFEDQVEKFIYDLLYFVNRYRKINSEDEIEIDKIIFNRATMVNETEMLDANKDQRGHISETTRLGNHPWVDDPEKEIEQMEEALLDRIDLDTVQIEEEEGGEPGAGDE